MNDMCLCGSGLIKWELKDARGIFCKWVCSKCVEEAKTHFRPEIFSDAGYYTGTDEMYEDIDPYSDEDEKRYGGF